ncbi:MAG: glycosyltransferase family 4 protein [Woeseiaceae bacterium]|nr:glycosyltransferase family 4 protein [Woeseiaceae bacterium]
MNSPLRLLTYSTLYPNASMPRHGVFVEQRLRKLLASGDAESQVVAPVPWFPFRSRRFGEYADFARAPHRAERHGIEIRHPRYLRIPKIGMSAVPATMAAASIGTLKEIQSGGYDFDLIDAHYFFPDGVAAVKLARQLGKPVLITARGTDLNLIPKYRVPRKMIQQAAAHADGLITVCEALKDSLTALGVPEERVTVLRNGVDLDFFVPTDRPEARKRLGLEPDRTILLSVGLLIDRKGHDIPIRALADLPTVHLLIAGSGEKREALGQLAKESGVADRVRFLGNVPHEELRYFFSAADAMVLASSREGWANVLLESMACGTPVIASNVWGTPEVVTCPAAGVLMEERTPAAFIRAFRRMMADYPDRSATRRYAEGFSWDDTTNGQLELMRRVVGQRGARA